MSEVVAQTITPEERVSRMRDLLGYAADNDFADVEVLGAFIDLYEEHDMSSEEGRLAFYEKLDFPEHNIIFGDSSFDFIVERYDELGGIPRYQLRGESEMEPEPVAEPAPEPDAMASLETVRASQLHDGDLVIRGEQLAGRSQKNVDALIKKVGELGFSLARLTRPSITAEELLSYDPEGQPSLGAKQLDDLRGFLETAGMNTIIRRKVESLLFAMNYAALNPREADVTLLDFEQLPLRPLPLLTWTESGHAYNRQFRPYPPREGLLIDMDELEWHMRHTDFYRSYAGTGTKTVSAVNSFVNARITEITAEGQA